MSGERELQSVATLIMGTSPKGDTYNNDGVGTPLLNGPTEFGPVHPDCTLFTTKPLRMSGRGDLLLCVRGSTGRMNWADQPYALGRGVASIRADTGLETRFVRYCLEARLTSLLSRATGSTFTNLKVSDISTFPIPWPDSRQKVAVVLAAYDELIENNLRRIEILEEMAQAVYREWFVNFRFPGHEAVALVDSRLGAIPDGWEATTLGDRVELAYGKALKADDRRGGDIPVLGSSGVVGWHDEALVAGPGIVVGRKGNVGSVHWVDTDFCPIDTTFYVVSDLPLVYVVHNLRHQNFINSDAAVPGLNRNQAYANPLVVPPPAVLDQFAQMVDPTTRLVKNLRDQNINLRTTRDLLLPKLVSGALDVSDLDIDTEWLAS